MRTELKTKYDSRQSFYGKAEIEYNGDRLELYSYNTLVAYIKDNNAYILGQYSQTTTRHQKDFLKQNGFRADNIKQMLKDYSIEEE